MLEVHKDLPACFQLTVTSVCSLCVLCLWFLSSVKCRAGAVQVVLQYSTQRCQMDIGLLLAGEFTSGVRLPLFRLRQGRNSSQRTSASPAENMFKTTFEYHICFLPLPVYKQKHRAGSQGRTLKAADCCSTLQNATFWVIKKLLSCIPCFENLWDTLKKYFILFLIFPFSLFSLWLFLLSLFIVFSFIVKGVYPCYISTGNQLSLSSIMYCSLPIM